MPRVVVFGSSNTDLTMRVPRLPELGQTILGSSFTTTPGGKGANQAVAARRAGADVVFITAVGNDDLGRQALELYRREGIDVSHVRVVEGVASGVALIFVGDDGENLIGVAPGANHRLIPEDIDGLPASLFGKDEVVLASLEIPVETALRALRRGAEAGMLTILNPAPVPAISESAAKDLLSAATVLTPNRVEALALTGMTPEVGAQPDWPRCAERLLAMRHLAVVLTLGSRGCEVATAEGIWSIGAHRVEAVDTVGAGDAFSGALAVALAEGRSPLEAAAWANAAAALAVTQPGAQSALPNRDAIDRLAARGAPPYRMASGGGSCAIF
jgi:ribokinase